MNAKLQVVRRARELVDLDRLARMQPDELRRLHRRLFGCDLPFGNAECGFRAKANGIPG